MNLNIISNIILFSVGSAKKKMKLSIIYTYIDWPGFWQQRVDIQRQGGGTQNWTVQKVIEMAKTGDILEAMT